MIEQPEWRFPGLSQQVVVVDVATLDRFYMVGQWAGGPGLPNVAAMGRKVIETICKRDERQFVTSLP